MWQKCGAPRNPVITSETDPNFRPISAYWGWIPWDEVIFMCHPELKLRFEDTVDDWALFDAIRAMADETGIDFVDAAAWVLKEGLRHQYDDARNMARGTVPWDDDVLHMCRALALLVCNLDNPGARHTLREADKLIWKLLATEDEILAAVRPGNSLIC